MVISLKYLLGIDFGGGASKATLLSEKGDLIATASVEYPTNYPKPGYAEQNAADWYEAIKRNIAQILKTSGVSSSDILSVCLDAATHTAVLMDEAYHVLRPCIYWTDSRSTAQSQFLRENYGELIWKQTLHKADTVWTLPQLLWIKENEPETFAKTKRILFAKDYIRFLLTGEAFTDTIEAQGSMFFDNTKQCWSKELCALLGFDETLLPNVVSPMSSAGSITEKAAEETGLCRGTKVICGTTDTALEVFAAGAVSKGDMTIKLATAGRICVVTDRAYPNQNLINYSHVSDGLWYPGTATKSCAASLRWYRDTFGGTYGALDEEAAKIPVGCDGLLFHPYLNGELTPYADPFLRGSFTGVRAGHTKAHFTRAVLEGVAFSLLDCKTELEKIGIAHKNNAVIIGGGSESALWRQIVSDALGITLLKTENSDSSFGGAMLAGVSAGVFDSLQDALNKCVKTVSITEPNHENTKKYAEYFTFYKKIHDALAPIYRELPL